MYRNFYNQPAQRIPVRRAPISGASPYPSRPAPVAKAEIKEGIQPAAPPAEEKPAPSPAAETDWQGTAQRLQAEMDNFRKRQTRRADEAIAAERERLLRSVLPLADNLNRALTYNHAAETNLRQGVELTQRELLRFLEAEGVTRIEAVGQPFTPELHEAVAIVPAQAASDTVVQEAVCRKLCKLLIPLKGIGFLHKICDTACPGGRGRL